MSLQCHFDGCKAQFVSYCSHRFCSQHAACLSTDFQFIPSQACIEFIHLMKSSISAIALRESKVQFRALITRYRRFSASHGFTLVLSKLAIHLRSCSLDDIRLLDPLSDVWTVPLGRVRRKVPISKFGGPESAPSFVSPSLAATSSSFVSSRKASSSSSRAALNARMDSFQATLQLIVGSLSLSGSQGRVGEVGIGSVPSSEVGRGVSEAAAPALPVGSAPLSLAGPGAGTGVGLPSSSGLLPSISPPVFSLPVSTPSVIPLPSAPLPSASLLPASAALAPSTPPPPVPSSSLGLSGLLSDNRGSPNFEGFDSGDKVKSWLLRCDSGEVKVSSEFKGKSIPGKGVKRKGKGDFRVTKGRMVSAGGAASLSGAVSGNPSLGLQSPRVPSGGVSLSDRRGSVHRDVVRSFQGASVDGRPGTSVRAPISSSEEVQGLSVMDVRLGVPFTRVSSSSYRIPRLAPAVSPFEAREGGEEAGSLESAVDSWDLLDSSVGPDGFSRWMPLAAPWSAVYGKAGRVGVENSSTQTVLGVDRLQFKFVEGEEFFRVQKDSPVFRRSAKRPFRDERRRAMEFYEAFPSLCEAMPEEVMRGWANKNLQGVIVSQGSMKGNVPYSPQLLMDFFKSWASGTRTDFAAESLPLSIAFPGWEIIATCCSKPKFSASLVSSQFDFSSEKLKLSKDVLEEEFLTRQALHAAISISLARQVCLPSRRSIWKKAAYTFL